jgi:hypothetical protein
MGHPGAEQDRPIRHIQDEKPFLRRWFTEINDG